MLECVRLGQVRLGQVRLGQVRFGQVSFGQDRLGQVRLSQVRLGQVRLGQVRLGWVGNKSKESQVRLESVNIIFVTACLGNLVILGTPLEKCKSFFLFILPLGASMQRTEMRKERKERVKSCRLLSADISILRVNSIKLFLFVAYAAANQGIVLFAASIFSLVFNFGYCTNRIYKEPLIQK